MEDQDTAPAALPPLRVLLCRAAPRRAATRRQWQTLEVNRCVPVQRDQPRLRVLPHTERSSGSKQPRSHGGRGDNAIEIL